MGKSWLLAVSEQRCEFLLPLPDTDKRVDMEVLVDMSQSIIGVINLSWITPSTDLIYTT
jgi:hypothetical protein